MRNRMLILDLYRALAVVLMLIFHFAYDLHYFRFTEVSTVDSLFWIRLRTIIVTLFMTAVGMSLYLAYAKSFNTQKYLKRLLLLGFSALMVSVGTFFVFPQTWVYFGVLHMVFVATLIGPLFVRVPHLSALIGVLILGLYYLEYRITFFFELLKAPLHLPLGHTEDLVPLIPWFAPVLFGIFTMHYLHNTLALKSTPTLDKLAFIGRHSLVIYLIHQPLFFALLSATTYMLR